MYPLTVSEIKDVVDGRVSGPVNLDAQVQHCTIDSRSIPGKAIFFALEGRHSHGARYASQALRDGASVVVVDEAVTDNIGCPCLVVPDAEIALAQLGYQNRQLSEALVVGVTGSVGKTTTRCMVTSVLDQVHSGVQSPQNYNNQLGVPLSLLEISPGHEFATIEIAASQPGEIGVLSRLSAPEFGIVTTVSPAHLRGFESLRTVQREKQQLIESLPADGVAFLNADDPLVEQMKAVAGCRVVLFGKSEDADVRLTSVENCDGLLRLTVDGASVEVSAFGRHHATSVMAAVAVGREIGMSDELIAAGLAEFSTPGGRCAIQQTSRWTVIDDTYNSSPASVTAAVRAVEEFQRCNHRVLVLGDMLDLGEQAEDLHYGIGATIASSGIDHTLVCGEFAEAVADGFLSSGGGINGISVFTGKQQLRDILELIAGDGDAILVKGSRATQMDSVVRHLNDLAEVSEPPALRRAA